MAALVATGTAIGFGGATPRVASACTIAQRYYYSDTVTTYQGGIDGTGGAVNVDSVTPYVCDPTQGHTVESTALYLPYGQDLIENGQDEGAAGLGTTSCSNNCSGQYHYFQLAYLPYERTGTIDFEWAVSGNAHFDSIQEFVTNCPRACQLYARFITDATQWNDINLPAGDNPGYAAVVNGEVTNEPETQMGGAVWSQLEIHAGNWGWWTKTQIQAGQPPYCQLDLNRSATNGQSEQIENFGPVAHPQYCNG